MVVPRHLAISGKFANYRPELLAHLDNPGKLTVPENEPHIRNWIECIKSRDRCTADIEFGQRSSTLCYLVNIERDLGQVRKKLQWDPVTDALRTATQATCRVGQLLS